MKKKGGITFLLLFFLFGFLGGISQLLAQRVITQEQTACQYLAQGKIDKALTILQNELKINADNLNARLYLGIAFYLKKDLEGASQQLERIEKEVDRMSGASRPFGDEAMFTEMGMERKADLLFSKERRGLLYFFQGLILKEKKDLKKAEKKFKKALEFKYDEKASRLQLFDLYIRQNDIKAATKQWQKLKEGLEDEKLFNFLDGFLKYKNGQIEEALANFAKLSSSNLEAKRNTARIHYNQGQYQKAAAIWQEILTANPQDKEAAINLGRAYFHFGDKEKAHKYFAQAGLKIAPEKYSPKKIPLIYGQLIRVAKLDLLCQAR